MFAPVDHAEVVSDNDVAEMAAPAEVLAPLRPVVDVAPEFLRAGAVAPSFGSRRVRPDDPHAVNSSVAAATTAATRRADFGRRWQVTDIDAETRPTSAGCGGGHRPDR